MIPRLDYHNFRERHQRNPKKHLFICEKIWETKQNPDEDKNIMQLANTLRDHSLEWYMSLDVNNP
jgi:hypothetical protein